jgi:two-component system LytT family response regulator
MAIKVMLIEDEAGIRLILRKIIERHPEFEIVAECEGLSDAVVQFHHQSPEVVFLDIGIKENNGVECARILTDLNPKVKLIFATAHAEYMAEAFELYAFDYLLKPFSIERVNQTLERIAHSHNELAFEKEEKVVQSEYRREKLLVKGKESMSFVDIPEIILIQRENHSTVIYTEQDSYVTSASLSELEKKLDPEQFLRSHKSYIINLLRIRKIEPYGRWTYLVHFKGRKEDALLTAEKYEEIKKRFL